MLHVQEVTVPYGDWSLDDQELLSRALAVLTKRLRGDVLSSPDAFKQYLRLRLGGLGYEMFGVVFLDAQQSVIAIEEMFRGTLTQTSVYPREVAMRALRHNAACLVIFHNHPAGISEPSRADVSLTETLKKSLELVDVRLLDHIVVAAASATSMAS